MPSAHPTLMILTASTRPGRVGPAVAKWALAAAQRHGGFDPRPCDLAEVNLPVFDEPHHPRMQKYTHEHTKRWAALVAAADAFVLVCPEYNFGPTPALLNALNYLYVEWMYKPAAFVSYGGISGGLRGVQMTKLTLTTLCVMPIYDAVMLPNVNHHLAGEGEQRTFTPTEQHEKSAAAMLNELHKWAVAMRPMRPA
jgi:NAD(P)H-dependent FMN reductase